MANANHKHNITENSIVWCHGYEATVRDVHTEGQLEGFLTLRMPGGPVTVHHSSATLVKRFDTDAAKAEQITTLENLIVKARADGHHRLPELEAKLDELTR